MLFSVQKVNSCNITVTATLYCVSRVVLFLRVQIQQIFFSFSFSFDRADRETVPGRFFVITKYTQQYDFSVVYVNTDVESKDSFWLLFHCRSTSPTYKPNVVLRSGCTLFKSFFFLFPILFRGSQSASKRNRRTVVQAAWRGSGVILQLRIGRQR